MSMANLDQTTSGPVPGLVAAGRPVLVPVDFSACSRAALTYAARVFSGLNSPLLILHVVHAPGNEPDFYQANGESGVVRPIVDVAREMLTAFVNDVCGGEFLSEATPTPELILVEGLPATRIQEVARREDVASIVMGTHGHIGLARLTMGSVASDVVQRCTVPVTIVKAPGDADHEAGPVE